MRAVAVIVALTGCQMDSYNGSTATQSPNTLADKVQAVSRRMHERYGGARRLLEAIARSDLDRVHEEATRLAALDEPDVLAQWRPYFDAVAETARGIAASSDVVAAGKQFAMLGVRCAVCHEAAGAKLVLPPMALAGTGSGSARMADHHHAALAMWEGLMAPSDDRWRAGARALTTVPLTLVAQAVTPASEQDVDDVARVRLYARRAVEAGDRTARADALGTLLGTCAHCHATLRDR
jgi:mono/diheme cytochrome c family protein